MVTDQHNIENICTEVAETIKAKNADYNGAFARRIEHRGYSYAVDKILEKADRVEQLSSHDNKVQGESLRDALLDCMGYCALFIDQLDQASAYE